MFVSEKDDAARFIGLLVQLFAILVCLALRCLQSIHPLAATLPENVIERLLMACDVLQDVRTLHNLHFVFDRRAVLEITNNVTFSDSTPEKEHSIFKQDA